jgi:hypothetical protein
LDDFKKLANRGSKPTFAALEGERSPGNTSTTGGLTADNRLNRHAPPADEPTPNGRPGSLSRPGPK